MLQEYPTTRCSKRCSVSGREFRPGEVYYSVLVTAQQDLIRQDIAAEHWQGPPEGVVGWWRCQVPAAGPGVRRPAPNSVLLDVLSDLLERPEQADLAFVLALLLVRRRVLSEESTSSDQSKEAAPGLWTLVQPADGRRWFVPIRNPSKQSAQTLQESLLKLLFTED